MTNDSLIEKLEAKICGNYTAKEAYGRGLDSGLQIAIEIIREHTPEPVSKVQAALESAAEILANFKGEGERTKQEEWEACYAMLFKQMNDLVNAKGAEQPVDCREAFETWCLTNSFHYENGLWKAWQSAWDERAKRGK